MVMNLNKQQAKDDLDSLLKSYIATEGKKDEVKLKKAIKHYQIQYGKHLVEPYLNIYKIIKKGGLNDKI